MVKKVWFCFNEGLFLYPILFFKMLFKLFLMWKYIKLIIFKFFGWYWCADIKNKKYFQLKNAFEKHRPPQYHLILVNANYLLGGQW